MIGTVALIGLILYFRPAQFQSVAPMTPDDSPFRFSFDTDGVLEEAGAPEESSSAFWWLDSGGRLTMRGLRGETMQGEAGPTDAWRIRYAIGNPRDTDQGVHPQNIFRLVTRAEWKDARIRAIFFISRDNFGSSPNRNSSNGVFLMSRYTDAGQTLYYTGVRVDGTAVIKKKYRGTYYTLAQEKIFPGTYRGDRDDIPPIGPERARFGLGARCRPWSVQPGMAQHGVAAEAAALTVALQQFIAGDLQLA